MTFKINISEKNGKTWKFETDTESVTGKKIGDKISGEELKSELSGFELEITGISDKAGFPGFRDVEGLGLKRKLLSYGKGMKATKPKGLRLKKTVRGNTISKDIVQINTRLIKSGNKKLEEIFPEQNHPKEKKKFEQQTQNQEEKKE